MADPLVYIICDYDEGGPESLRVTTDAAKVQPIISDWLAKEAAAVLRVQGEWKRESLGEYLAEVMSSFSCLDLQVAGSHNLSQGWGGLQLHIVKVENG